MANALETIDGAGVRDPYLQVVETALSQDETSGMVAVLRAVAEAFEAHGCILWEQHPTSDLDATPPRGRFFVLFESFSDGGRCILDDLPLDSVTGRAVLDNEPQKVEDTEGDQRVFLDHPFLRQAGIRSFCSVPVRYFDGARGALNIYRRQVSEFSAEELDRAGHLAGLFPSLYQAVRDRVSFELVEAVTRILNSKLAVPGAGSRGDEPDEGEQNALDRVAKQLGAAFGCMETSIFLKDPGEDSDRFRLRATTWQWDFPRTDYEGTENEGCTGWVLAHRKPARVFNLLNERTAKEIDETYPGMVWIDSLNGKENYPKHLPRELRGLAEDQGPPPLSFMAVPVQVGERLHGVIRCSMPSSEPFYFADRELVLLGVVAAAVGRYWSNWLHKQSVERENAALQRLLGSVQALNLFVHDELAQPAPREEKIIKRAVATTARAIPEGTLVSVRLVDDAKEELCFAELAGQALQTLDRAAVDQLRRKRFSLGGETAQSAGAQVYRTNETYKVDDAREDPLFTGRLPQVTRAVLAPIAMKDEVYGVLDVCLVGPRELPHHAETIVSLIGQQLGLYHHLATTVARLKQARGDLQKLVKQQSQTFQDLTHQIKSPILQAHARARQALGLAGHREPLTSKLHAIRGLTNKAQKVALSAHAFARLAGNKALNADLVQLRRETLVKMLIEACADHRVIVEPSRKLQFRVRRGSLHFLDDHHVLADLDLLQQAVNNLLDNAAKYSFANTRVLVLAQLTDADRFALVVSNKGLPVVEADIPRCKKRGWRSDPARWTTGEGEGIGLWIVDHIMAAHDGALVVEPTDERGITRVKLTFPMVR